MSGLNPFRPKNLEGQTAHHHQPYPPAPIPSSSKPLDALFIGHPSIPAVGRDPTSPPSPNAKATTTPPLTTTEPGLDNSESSDDQSESDPFSQYVNVNHGDAERAQMSPEAVAATCLSDSCSRRNIRRITPPPASSDQASNRAGDSGESGFGDGNLAHIENYSRPLEDRAIGTSIASSQSSTSLEDSDKDSTMSQSRSDARAERSRQPISLGFGIDLKALASRPGNRDRMPPPPPRTHHGKMINALTPTSDTTHGKPASRTSFHGSSPGPSAPHQKLQEGSDYFTTPSNQLASTDVLRRSQSQHKRPPTPPLSRRHSQMRRSRSTLSKPSSSQLSAPNSVLEAMTSAPSSPGSQSFTPSLRSGDSRVDSSNPDESSSNSELRLENMAPTSSLQPTTTAGLENQSKSRTSSKRASLMSQIPPPPPPRRTRGSNNFSESHRLSLHPDQQTGTPTNFVPHPSNAKDILDDLSRLQKEVDDLRGHFEHRTAK